MAIDLGAIRNRQARNKGTTGWDDDLPCGSCWFNASSFVSDIDALLEEVERLRAEVATADCPHCGEGMANHQIVTCAGGNAANRP